MRAIMPVARVSALLHTVLIVASVLAFWLVIDRPVPSWTDPRLWWTVYGIGMAWTGPMYIVTGFAAALAGWIAAAGVRRGLLSAAAVVLISLGMELLGVATGFPFGGYAYGDTLGPKVLGLVPIVIPLSWFMMLYASAAVAARFRLGLLGLSVVAALGLLAWDVLMDPAMSAAFPFWSWHTTGVYYGMPLVNWAGWMLTGILIGVPFFALAGVGSNGTRGPLGRFAPAPDPHDPMARLRAQRLPLFLYALNGLFPLALAIGSGMIGAAVIGGIAMLLFLASPLLPLARPVGVSPLARHA